MRMCCSAVPEEIEPAGQEAVDEEEAGDARGLGRADREAPAQRQPFEVHREHELQDDGEPEGGNRQAADGDDAHDVVEGGVVPDGGQRAERYADERGKQQREEGELEVAGRRRAISLDTGRPVLVELPRSACATWRR